MSTKAVVWAKETPFGGPSRKLVMLVLADYADEAWSCFPGQELIAEQTELGVRTVRRILADLEADGWIRRERRTRENGSRTSDRIYLARDRPADLAGRQPANHDSPTGHSRSDLPATVAGPEPSGEPREEPSASPPPPTSGAQLALVADPAPPAEDASAEGVLFDRFWEVFPRREGKGAARAAWAKACRKVGMLRLIEAAERYAADPNLPEDRTKIPHPATWLNQERWDDDPLPPRAGPTTAPSTAGQSTLLRIAAGAPRPNSRRPITRGDRP